jgi:hypothetical protein
LVTSGRVSKYEIKVMGVSYEMCCLFSQYKFTGGMKEGDFSIVNNCRLFRNVSKYVTLPVSNSRRLILKASAVRSSNVTGVRCFRKGLNGFRKVNNTDTQQLT